MPPSASVLELTWTGIAVVGIAVAATLWAYIWASYCAVAAWIAAGRAMRWGPRHKFVLGFLVGAALLVLIWLGFAALGVNAMLNAAPTTPDREAASERGAWILVGLEGLLFVFQGVLMAAWIGVGRPSLRPVGEAPTLATLLLHAIDAGRELGHVVANDLQPAVALLDELARDPAATAETRVRAGEAVALLDRVLAHVRALHQEIKSLEPKP